MIPEIKLSARLEAAAKLAEVRKGKAADIGTDHALLPIKLVQRGFDSVLASDIKENPCERARINIEKYGMTGSIKVVCRPGLEGIEEFEPDTIIICGMGGEMISQILSDSSYPEKSQCRLVLQPMTMQDKLRKHLAFGGFLIEDELIVCEDGKYYQLIAAVWDGIRRDFAEYEYRLGRLNLERMKINLTKTEKDWLQKQFNAAIRRIEGRKNSKNSFGTAEQTDDIEMAEIIKNILKF